MDLKQELTDYEIGGIGDIKKHTLRFHSYRMGTEGGKLTIYAEYDLASYWNVLVNALECYYIHVEEMVQDLGTALCRYHDGFCYPQLDGGQGG